MKNFLLASCLLISGLAEAQTPQKSSQTPSNPVSFSKKEVKKSAKEGLNYFSKEDYHKSLTEYEKVLRQDPNNAEALRNAGICHLIIYADETAITYLTKAQQKSPQLDKDFYYWLGRAYHLTMKFDSAAINYEKYKNTLAETDTRRQEADRLIEQTRLGAKYVSDSTSDFYQQNLESPVNSDYSEHSPILTKDKKQMIFTSTKTQNKKGEEVTPKGEAYEHIYSTEYKDGKWTEPVQIKEVDKKKTHTSDVQLFENDSKMLIYRSSKKGSLLVSERKDGKWTEPKVFTEHTNTGSYESNGFIMKDGSLIYFASDKDSKNGKLDLYVSRKKPDGTWSEPERLPETINTPEDEESPYLSDDGKTLYFSSKGHDSMGGYDVFKSTLDEKTNTWSQPVNMGYPMNTPGDDVFLTVDEKNKTNYLTSNRAGGKGQEDIYMVKQYGNVVVYGKLVKSGSGEILTGYSVKFMDTRDPAGNSQSVEGSGTFNTSLKSNRTYKVIVMDSTGKTVKEEIFYLPSAREDTLTLTKTFELPPDAIEMMAKLMLGNRNLVKVKYEAQKPFYVRGMVKDSATFEPIASAGVRVRQENSDETVFSTQTDPAGRYKIEFTPPKTQDYIIEIAFPGYLLTSIALVHSDTIPYKSNADEFNTIKVNVVEINTLMNAVRVGSRTVWGGIYFDFNKADIHPESRIVLNKLYDFLDENPTVHLEISGHTDGLGSAEVNLRLSQRRTSAVVEYLVKKGIKRNRLVAKAFGSNHPIAPNDTELNGRDVNRRVEVMILSK
jgi:outer membrane protein OmpA-like peptidoglycan-associated protein